MAYIPKPNTGSLFKNDHATAENKQPAYRGDCVLADGTLLEIGAWLNKTQDGRTYMSLKFKPPRPKTDEPPLKVKEHFKNPDPTAGPYTKPTPAELADDDSDIPF